MGNTFVKTIDLTPTNTLIANNKTVIDAIRATDFPATDALITTVDNKIVAVGKASAMFVINDTLLHSNDSEVNATTTSYVKKKEILIPYTSIIRIKFSIKIDDGTGYGKIYKNGISLGTERVNLTNSYVEYTEDLSFDKGDLLQLYMKVNSPTYTVLGINLRIYGVIETTFINNSV